LSYSFSDLSAQQTISSGSKVIVVSDMHLGYANSDASAFLGFLDILLKRNDVGTLIVLGDYVDMWRRDVSGLFLEFWTSVQKLIELSSSVSVHIVAGNHDYHLLKLQGNDYPFLFLENYSVSFGGTNYIFKHGWEFDYAQQPPVMELLCHNLSDSAGADRSAIYNALTGFKNELGDLFHYHNGMDGYVNHLMQRPEDRLAPYIGDVEKRAFSSLAQGEKLVFGHTHRPFVSSDGRVANSGSWVTDAAVHNTYVELDGESMRLFNLDPNLKATEILLRMDPPA
jgi:UDP-2,3-diacylglucosamine pyrophosphatase LpxH